MKRILCFIIVVMPLAFSCKHSQRDKASQTSVISTYKSDSATKKEPALKDEIFYGILTPVEICTIFNRLGIAYNNAALNPISNRDQYISNSKASINTGIYGADFGYLMMFGVGQQLIDYMVTIREMGNKLGIPDNYLTEPIKKVQSDFSDPDTILLLMNDAYLKMESHLRENGRESTAGLMIMGGWVEAMFISTQLVYNPKDPDPEVMQNIAQQKNSLATLLSLLEKYNDDKVVVSYSKKLKFLESYFDSFDISIKKGDREIDTVKQFSRLTGSKMTETVETINKIRDYVSQLRTEMVTP